MPDAFHDFEHAGWQRAASHYAGAFGDLTQQTIGPLLDAVGAGPGVRLLDVASGPGYVAAAAAARGARAGGVDFSAEMVALARRLFPAVSFQEGDAEALTFEAGSVDAVTMNFGLLHLARPDQAIAEAHRVLAAGGRFAFTVWADPAQAAAFRIVLQAIEQHGRLDAGLPEGPPFFRFSSAGECRAALDRVGFVDVQVRTLPLVWHVPDADAVVEAFLEGAVRTSALLRAQSPEALEAIRDAVRRGVEPYRTVGSDSATALREGDCAIPNPAVLASATKGRP